MLKLYRKIPVHWFNSGCLILALLWLVLMIPWSNTWYPTWPDFSQFYMGGLLARDGHWDVLYPIPRPGSLDNPGLSIHSISKPGWDALREIYVVPNDTRFILPPPSALVFVPFSFLPLLKAYVVWTYLLIGCVWSVALIAGRLYRRLSGQESRTEGWIALLIVFSPMTIRAIRIANVSPPIALMFALALYGLTQPKPKLKSFPVALVLVLGALLKYATLVFTPLLVAMRKWRALGWLVVLGVLSLAITVRVAGTAPFIEFTTVILPTLSRPSAYQGNQSLPGLLARLFGRPLPETLGILLTLTRLGSLIGIFYLLFRTPQDEWRRPVNVFSGAALLVSWLLIFSPIAWEHWPIFLTPMWGWLLWEARAPGARRFIALSALGLMYLPAGIFQVSGFFMSSIVVPEPLNSWQLYGICLSFSLAAWRLSLSTATEHVMLQRQPALST